MINTAIAKLAAGQNLQAAETRDAFGQIMSGGATSAQIAAFITAMRMKGETIDEITACAEVLREKCTRIHAQGDVLDIVGTGGDCANTFNISTTSAFVISAAGQPVAKHGNRSVSSKSGAADVLEALGVKIDLPAAKNEELLQKINLCFLFAQSCHASMRYAGSVRKEIGIRTVFNIIGPLANPAFASLQLLGVYQKELVMPLACVLANLGVKRGIVVYGDDGLDEVTVSATNTIAEIDSGRVTQYTFDPCTLGFKRCRKADLVGGDAYENAQITIDILSGRERGAKRDAVVLNSAMSLYIGGKGTLPECVELAKTTIDSGRAYRKLQQLIELSNG